MNTNPGGVLDPSHVVGRETEIERYWTHLQTRSLALLAPRRVGKTSICRRMAADGRRGFVCRWRDLEGNTRASEFVQQVYQDIFELLSTKKRAADKLDALVRGITGAVSTLHVNITLPEARWRDQLRAMFADLDAMAQDTDTTPVLFWDEFTLFVNDMLRHGHTAEAMALLDTLRAIRQEFPHVRMVFTGSIGLHEVLGTLKRQGYANDPFNDIERDIVPLMSPEAATALATELIRGTGVPVYDKQGLAAHVALTCEGHPFLVQHVVHQLKLRREMTTDTVDAVIAELLERQTDPLALEHYLERLTVYLTDHDARAARKVLDAVAVSDRGMSVDEVCTEAGLGRDDAIDLLRRLRRDLYLERTDGRYRFQLQLLRRWWRQERDL